MIVAFGNYNYYRNRKTTGGNNMLVLTRRVGEAAIGTGEAKAAIAQLGINAKEFTQLGVDEQLGVLADKLGEAGSEAEQLRLAFKLFDSEGTAVLQMLKGGSGALSDMAADAECCIIT